MTGIDLSHGLSWVANRRKSPLAATKDGLTELLFANLEDVLHQVIELLAILECLHEFRRHQ